MKIVLCSYNHSYAYSYAKINAILVKFKMWSFSSGFCILNWKLIVQYDTKTKSKVQQLKFCVQRIPKSKSSFGKILKPKLK